MRFDKTLPTHIDVGFRTIKLETVEYDEDFHEVMGQFENHNDRIVLCISGHPVEDANTLVHELLHVIYYQYLLDDALALRGKKKHNDMVRKDDKNIAEERIVNSMANGLTEIYLRNPKVATWIMDRLV